MSLNTPEMVLFDLDGTLIDTAPVLTYSVDTMLQKIDLPKRGEEKVRSWVGNGIERRVAGFQIACVSYDYNPGEDIRAANPDIVIDSLAELPQLI